MRDATITMSYRCRKAWLSGFFLVLGVLASTLTVSAQPVRLEVATAEAAFDSRTSEPVVTVRLTPDSAKLFASLTTKNVGRPMAFIVDGRVIMKPVIREPIIGGHGQISGNLTAAQAKAMAEGLASGKARLEVEVVD